MYHCLLPLSFDSAIVLRKNYANLLYEKTCFMKSKPKHQPEILRLILMFGNHGNAFCSSRPVSQCFLF